MQNIREVLKGKHSFDDTGRIKGNNFILEIKEEEDRIVYDFELDKGNYLIALSKGDPDDMEIIKDYKMSALEHVNISKVAWDMHQYIL